MIALLCFVLNVLISPFKSKSRLEGENAALRQQLTMLRRQVRGRIRLTNNDRLFFVQLYRMFTSVLNVITVIRTETLVRWHRAGFRSKRCAISFVLTNSPCRKLPIHDLARASARMSAWSMRRGCVPQLPGTRISLRARGRAGGRASLMVLGSWL